MSSATATKKSPPKPRAGREVRLRLTYIDFWSSVKLSFLIGLCFAIVTIVASFLVWTILNQFHIFDQVDDLLSSISAGTSLSSFFGFAQVMGFAIVGAILDVVVITALGAIGSVLYNLSVKITGGMLVGFRNE